MDPNMPEFLVTGGCGFIGSHLCDLLLQNGHRVRVLDDLSTGSLSNLPLRAQLIEGDIRNRAVVQEAIEGCDGCFHLAAIASVERGNLEWVGTHEVNQSGAIRLFEAARRAGRGGRPIPVVYASSAAIYGDQGDRPISEAGLPLPTSAYGADKLGCEHHARVAALVHGVATTGLRFFNVYGPRQDPTSPYSGVISIFCDRLRRELPITIFGDGQQSRDFVFVGDVVRGLYAAMLRIAPQPQVVNICTGRSTSVVRLAETLARLFRVELEVSYADARKGEIRHSLGDPTRARSALGFYPRTRLDRGLALTIGAGEAAVHPVPLRADAVVEPAQA